MIIFHKIDDFLFKLFPKTGEQINNTETLKKVLSDYYTFGPFCPKVDIEGEVIKIAIDTSSIVKQKDAFDTATRYCERGQFKKAKPIFNKLIKKNPTVSEYHRNLGQIYSEEGNQDKAINCLIDALRWDPKNAYALIMMGNIFGKHLNDIETAMTYYKQALKVNPQDHISMNNIGANLMQLGRTNEAEEYFEKALKINDSYPNTLYALAMIQEAKGNLLKAFEYVMSGLKKCKVNDPLYKNTMKLATEIGIKIVKQSDYSDTFGEYAIKLEKESVKPVDIVEDNTIPGAAKLEIAENYSREKHTVKYKKGSAGLGHLVMHELVHLDYTVQARRTKEHYLFVSKNSHKELFIRDNEYIITKLNQDGITDNSIADFITSLFNGMNSHIFNAPVDLFIEDFLYDKYPTLRPAQFISLFNLQKTYIDASTQKRVMKYSPATVKQTTLILNLVHCIQFKELFGYDLTAQFKPSPKVIKVAHKFYNEYLTYRNKNRYLDAYKLSQKWAEELNVNKYFDIMNEVEYRSHANDKDQTVMTSEEDQHITESPEPANSEQKTVSFKDEPAGQMAVTMYCLGALQYFENKQLDEIQKVGFEIGIIGRQGIDHTNNEKQYSLKSIAGKKFTGLQLLAYMYVAFQYIDPHLDIGINFKDEYENAKSMHKKDKND